MSEIAVKVGKRHGKFACYPASWHDMISAVHTAPNKLMLGVVNRGGALPTGHVRLIMIVPLSRH